MDITTDGVLHTEVHTLKEILSLWFVMYGTRAVRAFEIDNVFRSDTAFAFNRLDAVDSGYMTRRTGAEITYQLTQKALDYIMETDNETDQ